MSIVVVKAILRLEESSFCGVRSFITGYIPQRLLYEDRMNDEIELQQSKNT